MSEYGYGLNLVSPLPQFNVSSGVGPRAAPKTTYGHGTSIHNAVDLHAAVGTPVYATHDGVVTRVKVDPKGYGLYAAVCNSATGVCTNYAHLSDTAVKVGDKVSAGGLLAHSGRSGNVSGPHLDYTVVKDGVAIKPNGEAFAYIGDKKPWLVAKNNGALPVVGNSDLTLRDSVAPTAHNIQQQVAPNISATPFAGLSDEQYFDLLDKEAATQNSLLAQVSPLNRFAGSIAAYKNKWEY